MISKKIAIFPIQAKSLIEEDIYFAKTLTLFINLSLESLTYVSSSIVKLINKDTSVISESLYIRYTIDELLDIYNDNTIDYILFLDMINKKNSYLITYYIYDINKILKNKKDYILSKEYSKSSNKLSIFETTYSLIISDILIDMGESLTINLFNKENGYNLLFSKLELFDNIKNIINYDNTFFNTKDEYKYIIELKEIYITHKEISIVRYIIKKLLNLNNIFFVYDIINSIEKVVNNDYVLLLLSTTLMEFKQYKEAIKILNSINRKSIFFSFKKGLINSLKAEAYLKLNNLKLARKYIVNSVKNNIKSDNSYELFLEIMFKSKFFLAFKSYLESDSYNIIKENSYKANYWIARYYSEVITNNKLALSVIENFRFNIDIIFIYLKVLYRISNEDNNYDKLNNYILDLYNNKIFEYKESSNNNIEFVKLFVKIFLYMKQRTNILSFIIKEKIILQPYNEIKLGLNDVEKIVFNYIYDDVSLDTRTINKLLFFILGDYKIGVNKLTEKKDLYYYTKALTENKNKLKLLKKSLKLKMNISVLNKIIIYYYENKKYLAMKKYLKMRSNYVKSDEFDIYYTLKLLILRKKYKKALNLIESLNNISENIDILKLEIFFNVKEYDKMLILVKKYNKVVIKDNYLSYLNGWVLLKIKNNRKGLFYLQNSYNLKPNKTLQKQLIKEYKRYGIDYIEE